MLKKSLTPVLNGLICALCVTASWPAIAQTITLVHSFSNTPDGSTPQGGLTMGIDGALYGTTAYGGVYGIDPQTNSGNGTIFRVAPGNGYSVVYSFTHLDASLGNADGRWPNRGLLAAPDGLLYGVAPYGGQNDAGAAFGFSPSNGFVPLHSFGSADASTTRGDRPNAGLALGLDGRLYGSTQYGGRKKQGLGTVFGLATGGRDFKLLTSFGKAAGLPGSRLLAASDGLLYGIAAVYNGSPGGALYRIAPDGTQYQVVHAFNYNTEGGFYYVGTLVPPIEGPSGELYGATADGNAGDGAIYRVARDGSGFTLLHTFATLDSSGKNVGGGRVHTPLIFGPDGLLYGATQLGGANGTGVIYRMATDGSGFTTLFNFPATNDRRALQAGANPMGDIVFNTAGELCGTSYAGGTNGMGSVYCLKLD